MAEYLPPTEDVAIFDTLNFNDGDAPLTYNKAVKYFLRYPRAQGVETFPSGMKVQNIDSISTTTDVSLFTSHTGANISIGNGFSPLFTVLSATTDLINGVKTNLIDSRTTSTTCNLYTNNISGIMNIGTGTNRSGVINIGTSRATNGDINIGTPGLASSSVPVYVNGLRVQSYGLYFNQPCSFSANAGSNMEIGDLLAGGNISLGSAQVGGNINIGRATTRTGNINIGDLSTSANNIKMGSSTTTHTITGTYNAEGAYSVNTTSTALTYNVNTSASNSGAVNICSGASNSATVSISTGANNTGAVNISNGAGATASGSVNIGASTNLTGFCNIYSHKVNLCSSGDNTAELYVNAPFRPNYAGTLPSANTQVGYQQISATSTTVPSGTIADTCVLALTNGIWQVEGQIGPMWSGTPVDTLINFSLSTTLNTNDNTRIQTLLINKALISSTYQGRINSIFQIPAIGATVRIVSQVNGSAPNSCNSAIRATRIA